MVTAATRVASGRREPPRPRSLQPEFRARQARLQTGPSFQQSSVTLPPDTNESLVNKYHSGTLSENEFKQLFGDQFSKYGGNQDKATQFAYAKYYQSSNPNPDIQTLQSYQSLTAKLPKEIKQELGGSGLTPGQAITGKTSVVASTNNMPAMIGGEAIVGGYSSITGESVFITESGKKVTQAPASFDPMFSPLGPSFTPNVPKGTLPQSFVESQIIGDPQGAKFTEFKEPVKPKEKVTEVASRILPPQRPSQAILEEKKGSVIPEEISEQPERFQKGVEAVSMGVGEILGEGARRTSLDFLRRVERPFLSQSERDIYLSTRREIESPEGKATFKLAGQTVTSTGQYFLPIIGNLKAGSDVLVDLKKGKTSTSDILFGGITAVALKGAGKAFGITGGLAAKADSFVVLKIGEKTITPNILSTGVGAAQKGTEIAVPGFFGAQSIIGFEEKRRFIKTGEIRGRLEITDSSGRIIQTRENAVLSKVDSITQREKIARERLVEESRKIGSFTVGFEAGRRGIGIVKGAGFALSGKRFVERETIGDPLVITGQKTFPEFRGSPKKLAKKFREPVEEFEGPGGFTATTTPFRGEVTVGPGKSETPGIYIAPRVSEFFLRLKRTGEEPSIFPNLSGRAPMIARIKTPVKTLPSSVVKEYGGVALRKPAKPRSITQRIGIEAVPETRSPRQVRGDIAFSNLPKGQAYVSPQFHLGQKVESEAVLPQGNVLVESSSKEFTIIQGEAVPIVRFDVKRSPATGLATGFSRTLISGEEGLYRGVRPTRFTSGGRVSDNRVQSSRDIRSSGGIVSSSRTESYLSATPSRVDRSSSDNRILRERIRSTRRESFEPIASRVTQSNNRVLEEFSSSGSSIIRSPPRGPPRPPDRRGGPRTSPGFSSIYHPSKSTSSSAASPVLAERGFSVVLFREGKPLQRLGGVFVQEEAIALGKRKVGQESLLAGFKVFKTGSLASRRGITEPVGEEFTIGKRDPSLIIEKPKSRLSTPQEIGLIQTARRAKESITGKRNKRFNIL